jgi:hypothetical protein
MESLYVYADHMNIFLTSGDVNWHKIKYYTKYLNDIDMLKVLMYIVHEKNGISEVDASVSYGYMVNYLYMFDPMFMNFSSLGETELLDGVWCMHKTYYEPEHIKAYPSFEELKEHSIKMFPKINEYIQGYKANNNLKSKSNSDTDEVYTKYFKPVDDEVAAQPTFLNLSELENTVNKLEFDNQREILPDNTRTVITVDLEETLGTVGTLGTYDEQDSFGSNIAETSDQFIQAHDPKESIEAMYVRLMANRDNDLEFNCIPHTKPLLSDRLNTNSNNKFDQMITSFRKYK